MAVPPARDTVSILREHNHAKTVLHCTMAGKTIKITHRPTGTLIAEGPIGWGITPFEGNLYIRKQFLRTENFKPNYIPGLCIYKFLYVWLDLKLPDGPTVKNLGWMYWLPNPLFPFIWYRVALPRHHPELRIEEFEGSSADNQG